jgi:hypothetical protein
MEPEPLIYRDEVTAMLFTLVDIRVGILTIIRLLEKDDDGEEEA